jgi:hypothetical protein
MGEKTKSRFREAITEAHREAKAFMRGKPLPRESDPQWLISFLDTEKHTVDSVLIHAPTRNDARREALELYAQNGDRAIYAGFVVTEEKHGGY